MSSPQQPFAADLVTESAVAIGRRSRISVLTMLVGVLCVIAIVAALYLARAFLVPLLLGMLASYALRPLVDWLQGWRVPRALAAAAVLVVLVGGVSWMTVTLSDDAAAMIDKLPDAARKLRHDLGAARAEGPTPLQNMQEAANEIQGAAADAGAKLGARVVALRPSEPTAWLRDYALAQTALLFAVVAQTPIVLLLTYFLLASGTHFRRKLIQFVGPSLSRKKDAVRILADIDIQVQRYLFATLLANAMVAIGTWLTFAAFGIEYAAVWGVAAGLLHFIPYLGAALIVLGSGVAAFLQFGSLLHALMVAGAALLVAGAIGLVFMTWLQSRAAHVNATVLFIALLFFGWLWGIWGLLLGAPLVGIVKVVCEHIDELKPVGELLGE
jgi:predicted PurR-regulated permease PerM